VRETSEEGKGVDWLADSLLADPAAAKPATEDKNSLLGVFIKATPFGVRA
jgi:hypothetical protein